MYKRMMMQVIGVAAACAVTVLPAGCDEYERDQLREAGDDIDSAGRRVGDASGSALDRARSGTADAARNLGNDIDDRNDQVNDAADEADGN